MTPHKGLPSHVLQALPRTLPSHVYTGAHQAPDSWLALSAGTYCENTLEALAALIERDNGPDGPLRDLYYVEFDVHVRC